MADPAFDLRYLKYAMLALRQAVVESRCNGQTEGQIDRLKTLTRACLAA